ncbi:hypothetical protein CH267_13020 [Rhodococcus sp. 06-621-2]|nr:acyclic terpene utilization AtuA family protein [Rhodococcus sp. 06-621-2]OZC55493.1 hypothetical protein CH267_13020 [Rhodococcus sp. 06-621-2]
MQTEAKDAREPLRIYTPTAIIGYGFHDESFAKAKELGVDVITVDSGSSDPGPTYLGEEKMLNEPEMIRDDLEKILTWSVPENIPFITGTAGGSGSRKQLHLVRSIIESIAEQHGLSFRMAVIDCEFDTVDVLDLHAAGAIEPLWPVPDLERGTIERSARIVGLMGAEPYIRALEMGAQVIIAGRSDDSAITAGFAMWRGYSPDISWLAGKLLGCGAAVTEPKNLYGHDGVMGYLYPDSFELEPLHPELRCTKRAVARMLGHENENARIHHEPGGVLDLTGMIMDQLSERRIRLSEPIFRPEPMSIRLEGVEVAGYRSIVVATTRDPALIVDIDNYLERAMAKVDKFVASTGVAEPGEYRVEFQLIGHNATMGTREPVDDRKELHEIGIIADVVAPTQARAATIAAKVRTSIKNAQFPGKYGHGSVAFPFSPSEVEVGKFYRYSVWHVARTSNIDALFPIEIVEVKN